MSASGKPYGSAYKTLLRSGNIKFVKKSDGATESLLETMTKGRVYVELNSKNEPGAIHYYDNEGKRRKTIDLDHFHDKKKPHSHGGYYHAEYLGGLSSKERAMVDRVFQLWNNEKNKG